MIGSLLYHPGTVGLVFAQPSIEVVKAIGCRSLPGSPAPTNEAKEAKPVDLRDQSVGNPVMKQLPSAILQWQEYEFPPSKALYLLPRNGPAGL